MVAYLRAANVKDGTLDLSDVKEMNFDPKEQAWFSLRPGDVLVTEGSGSLRAVGASAVWSGEIDGVVCFQNTLLRLRPRPSTDPRFLAWWCRYAFADGLFASIATGANIFHVSADRVRALPLTYLPLAEQGAIANYLDAETVRIDALIAKKRRLIELLDEWLDATRTSLLSEVDRTTPLMHLTDPARQIMYGIVLPGPDVREGVPIVKGGDVARGLASVDGLCRTTPEIEAGYARARLRHGDLVFAIRGGIGDVAVVPPDVAGANITQDVARVSPGTGVDRNWLYHVLRSRDVQEQAAMRATGATIRGLNIWELKRITVPLVPFAEQQAVGVEIDRAQRTADRVRGALVRQIDLLVEHRQALITAAVTGELSVPGVAA